MKRLGLWIPWALFVAFCLGWTAWWFAARRAAEDALEAALARAKAAGVGAGYARVRASGFPLHLTLTLDDAHAAPSPALAIGAAHLPVSINLSNPRHIIVGLADGLSWRTGDNVVHTLRVARGDMSVRVGEDGKLARISLDLEDAHVTHGDAATTDIAKLLVHLRPDPRNEADAQLVVDADDWRGLTPFAVLNSLGPFGHFRAAVVVTHAASLMSRQPLKTWTGDLRIERFDVAYGDAAVVGDGQLALDAAHRPSGVLRLQPTNGQIVEVRAGGGWWTLAGLRVAAAKPLDQADTQ